EESRALITHLNARLGTMVELQTVSIGPTITGELKSKAVWAVVIALVLQLLYITFRFGNLVRFGLAADVVLVHDLVIMVGIYALSGRGVDSPFVAAVLTVMGYSVMDSVVIFDRIRENMKRLKGTFSEICNVSVNETMTRSVNTTLTVVLVCLALFFFGGSTLKNFAFALLVGIISGAYSSIFVASPILVEFDAIAKKREAERAQKRRLEAEARARQRKGPVEVAPSQDYPSAQELPDVNGKVAGRRPGERRRRKGTRRRGS
ncbi:MAG TPA: protein translocase subunit SecF, partial [Candidatus Nitrosotenuis sp.]|nr:protein translocase subunit SecF [Candidatus Nitrosotenuis sp.]